jgi:enoyl-CoA hydratase/carnithine racemase
MPYSQYQSLVVEVAEGIATVTLNRPDSRNAIDTPLHRELEAIWPVLEEDDKVQAIILTGAGKAFSAGGDIRKMIESNRTPDGWRSNLATLAGAKKLVSGILDLTKPLVCAINGDAIGLGTTIGLLGDITIAAETAKLGDTHVKVGLVAGDGGVVIWPLLLGMARAKEFLMRGRIVLAPEAADLGLINYALPAAEVMPKAREIAAEFVQTAPLALRWTKVCMNKILKDRYNLLMDSSIAYEILSTESRDNAEAARAMLERRPPAFEGW